MLHASNHSGDQGIGGLTSCDAYWQNYPQVLTTGIYTDTAKAEEIPLLTIDHVTFAVLNYTYGPNAEVLPKIIKLFDDNISNISMVDDRHFKITRNNETKIMSDEDLLYTLSSGTTKGVLLYMLMVVALRDGFDLLIDEIENHFHKTLVENMIGLFKDKSVNKQGASLVFTTHYCEVLDLFGRQDNIWIAKSDTMVYVENMHDKYNIRPELLKSKQFYSNAFKTAVNYEDLMALKKELLQ